MWALAHRDDYKPDADLRLVENALAFPTATVCCICDGEGGTACMGHCHAALCARLLRGIAASCNHKVQLTVVLQM